MLGKQHLTYGIVTGTCLASQFTDKPVEAVLLWSSCILGSVFPDIDLPSSTIGKRFPGISNIFNNMFGHRGFLHTPLFLVLLWWAFYFLVGFFSLSYHGFWILIGFSFGYICHLIQDIMTNNGIKVLWPITKKSLHLTNQKSSAKIHYIITAGLCLLSIFTSEYIAYGIVRSFG